MKKALSTFALAMMVSLCGAQTKFTIKVTNPLKLERSNQPVVIDLKKYGVVRSAQVLFNDDKVPVPYQLDDLDQDGIYDELCFLTDIAARETKKFEIHLLPTGKPREFESRVYAEMLLRNDKVKEKNRHNNYIESITARGDCANSYNIQHHHGVCFESELNGIRIYFDKRQTLDLYGKYHRQLELKETQFYTSDEQKKKEYGDDVLWVGNTFGLGAFRGWDGLEPTMVDPVRSRTQRIISYGPLRTIVEVIDNGWEAEPDKAPINMKLRYTQYAGHRDTDVDVFFDTDVSEYTFSTGIINVKGSEEFSDHMGLRACWGTDYPSTDTLKWSRETVGLAILIPQEYIEREEPSNTDNYPFVIKVRNEHMHYKISYTSAKEQFGFDTKEAWFDFVQGWRDENERPLVVK
jgi:hypothetical protein